MELYFQAFNWCDAVISAFNLMAIRSTRDISLFSVIVEANVMSITKKEFIYYIGDKN